MHENEHKLAGQTVTIKRGKYAGQEYRVEDYWDRVYGKGWGDSGGNPAAVLYAVRAATDDTINLPLDDEVLYGKIGAFGHLIHICELS